MKKKVLPRPQLEEESTTKASTWRRKYYQGLNLKKKVLPRPQLEEECTTKASTWRRKYYQGLNLKKRKYFQGLNLKKKTDNKTLWKTGKPFFSNKGDFHKQIALIEDQEIILDDKEVTEKHIKYFNNAVKSLEIMENKEILTPVNGVDDPIDIAIKRWGSLKQRITFSQTDVIDIEKEIVLNAKNETTSNIPVKHLISAAQLWIRQSQ